MNSLAGAADGRPAIIELTYLRMRNTQDAMTQRTNDFLSQTYIPALQRAGGRKIGAFSNFIGPGSPSTLLVVEYADAGVWDGVAGKLRADKEFEKAGAGFYSGPLPFVRQETVLLRGFPTMPAIEVPASKPEGKTRLFELRTYESNTARSLARKVRMFDEGEIAIFRRVGINPVFFGEALTGNNLPQLTYMVAYDDMAARDKAWATFLSDPEWDKLKKQPGASDAEIVSGISNSLLRPLPFSTIR